MATLVSPGVDVQIIDESFYGGAGPGTVPLIVFASAANKASPSGTGVAPYSVPNQAGKLFLATSQRELIQNFGSPSFKSVQGTQVHGHELNEYGLHAAYQFLGVSNRAYVLRADIDLAQLEPSAAAPEASATLMQQESSYRSFAMGHSRRSLSEAFGVGLSSGSSLPAPGSGQTRQPGAMPPPEQPNMGNPGQDYTVGEDVIIADEGKSYQAKVSSRNPDGTYKLTFGPNRPLNQERTFRREELQRIQP